MSDDRQEPPHRGTEAETLVGFLDYHRDTVLMKAAGLTQEQLATRLPPSELTLAGLLKHLALVEDSWLRRVFAGGELSEPFASVDWEADPDWEFRTAREDVPEELFSLFAACRARDDAVIAEALATNAGLDAPSARPSRETGEPFSLRWILVHLVEEYARHVGHADLIRESIDGSVGE